MAVNFPQNPNENDTFQSGNVFFIYSNGKWVSGTSPDSLVSVGGDTMTGPLILSGEPTSDLEASTKQYVDNNTSIGSDGATGPAGPAGTNGSTGIQGPPGPPGATGATNIAISSPIIDSITFVEDDPAGSRFSGSTFNASVNMLNQGTPTAQVTYQYSVNSDYTGRATTSPQSSGNNTQLTFADATNISQLTEGTALYSEVPDTVFGLAAESIVGGGDGSISALDTSNPNIKFNQLSSTSTGAQLVGAASFYNQTIGVTGRQVASVCGSNIIGVFTTDGQVYSQQQFNSAQPKFSMDPITGRTVISSFMSGPYLWWSSDGVQWTQKENFDASNSTGGYAVVSGDKIWQWDSANIRYSADNGNSSIEVNNPLHPEAGSLKNSINFGTHAILFFNQETYRFNLNTNGSSIGSYIDAINPFGNETFFSVKTFKHRTATNNLVAALVQTSQDWVITFDAGNSYFPITKKGVQDSDRWSESDLTYNYDEDMWYISLWYTGGTVIILKVKDIVNGTWRPLGRVGPISGTSPFIFTSKEYTFNYFIGQNTYGISRRTATNDSQPLYYSGNLPLIEGQISLAFPQSTSFAGLEEGQIITGCINGDIEQPKFTGIINSLAPGLLNPQINIITAYTDSTYIKWNLSEYTMFISPEQAIFTVQSNSGITVIGQSDRFNIGMDKYNGKTYSSSIIPLSQAKRFLLVAPNGEVQGFTNSPLPRGGYVYTDSINFPINTPGGSSWDTELPAGSSITVGVAADNTGGGGGRNPLNGYIDVTIVPS